MIRTLPVLFAALIAVSAQATPKLGDYAAFDVIASMNGQAMQASMEQEIIAEDATAGTFTERQTVQFTGQESQISEATKPVSDYLDDATIDALLANCAANGGTAQNITVPAGTFDTCAIPFDNADSSGTAWVTKVPFGVSRVDSVLKQNGVTVNSVLRSFR